MTKKTTITFYALPTLKECRKKKGYQQRTFVDILNASLITQRQRSAYAKIEDNRMGVDTDTALVISQILKTPINELFISKELFDAQSKDN